MTAREDDMARIIGPLRLSFGCTVLLAVGLATLPATAQQKTEPARALTAADYARAERLLNYNTTPLVFRTGIRPAWLTGERFWYRVTTQTGTEFLTVDPAIGTKAAAFDHAKLAAALSAAAGTKYSGTQLPFTEFTRAPEGNAILFSAAGRRWRCEADASSCAQLPGVGGRRGRRRPRGPRRPRRRPARSRLARRHARRVHPRLEPVGARGGERQGNGADDRRRQGLRLRDRQRRLDAERSADRALVARLEEDRDLPAGRAQRRRDVSRRHHASAIRSCRPGSTRCPATSTSR